jgi:hypothetical protein
MIRTFLLSAIAVGTLVGVANASPEQSRQIIKESITIEEARVTELEGMARNDDKLAHEIGKYVAIREKYASDAEASAKKFRDAAGGIWPHNSEADQARAALEKFASTMELFAKHDREQAARRKQAADILTEQARDAETGVKNHREHIAELKLKLGLLH